MPLVAVSWYNRSRAEGRRQANATVALTVALWCGVPRAGVEPARPLRAMVFETIASAIPPPRRATIISDIVRPERAGWTCHTTRLHMKLGIIGLPQSGKTTIFNALTRGDRPVGHSAGGGRFEVQTRVGRASRRSPNRGGCHWGERTRPRAPAHAAGRAGGASGCGTVAG